MPFTPDTNTPIAELPGIIPGSDAIETTAKPAFWSQIIPASFRMENTIGSYFSEESDMPEVGIFGYADDPNFDPFEDLQGTAYDHPDTLKRFLHVNTNEEREAVKRQIDRENQDRETLDAAGWEGVAGMLAAGVIDPVNLIPVGGSAYKGYRAGGSILKGGLRTARAGLVSSSAAELVLHDSQQTRTWGESAANVAVGTFLSGIIGGGALKVRELVEVRQLKRGVRKAETAPESGTLSDTVEIGLGDLQEGLEKAFVTQGRGHLKEGVSDVANASGLPPLGDMELEFNSGLVKIVWGHGAKSLESPDWQVRTEDLTIMPSIFRRMQPFEKVTSDGRRHWKWVVERDVGHGPQRVVYIIKELTKESGRPKHLVSVHVLRGGQNRSANNPLSPTRKDFRKQQKKNASEPEIPGHGLLHSQDTFDGVSNSSRRGPDSSAPDDIIAKDGGEVTPDPFARQAGAWDDVEARVDDDLTVPHPDKADVMTEPGSIKLDEEELIAGTENGDMGSVGAAAARTGDEKVKSAFGVENVLKTTSPGLRVAMSESVESRRVVQDLVETPFTYEKNIHGIATEIPVEAMIRQHQARLATGIDGVQDAFLKYRTGTSASRMIGVTASDALPGGTARRGGKLAWKEFKEEAGRAARRDDTHSIPEVAQAAAIMRREVFEPFKEQAISYGLLPEDVKVETAASYLTRVYNNEKIAARRPEFVNVVSGWLRGARDGALERIAEATVAHDDLAGRIDGMNEEAAMLTDELSAAKTQWRQGRDRVKSLKRDVAAANREARTFETELGRAERREKKFIPSPDLNKSDPLKQALQDLRRGGGAGGKPMGLASWLNKNGGLIDQGSELTHIGLNARTRPGLVRAEGNNLDDATLKAWEAGYFPGHDERPVIDDLVEALRDDINGAPVLRQDDLDKVAYRDYLDNLGEALDEIGVDITKVSDAEVKAAIDAFEVGKAPKFRDSTPATRAKAREIAFYKRRADERLETARERLETAQAKLDEAIALRNDARLAASDIRPRLNKAEMVTRDARRRLDKLSSKVDEEADFARADDEELSWMAEDISHAVTGTANGRLLYEAIPLARGPLKERSLSIPDALIEEFLESDIELIAKHYVRTMAPDIELTARFGRADMEGQITKIRDDYTAKMRGDISERQRVKLNKAMKSDIRDVEGLRDILRGTYAAPANPDSLIYRASRGVRNWNYLRLLGGMTVSAFPDVARPMMVHGLSRVLGNGVAPLVTGLKSVKLAGREAKLAGTALDMTLDSRAMSLADVGDDFGRHSKFERGLKSLTDRFGMVSVMAPWNAALKQWAGAMSSTRIGEEAANWTAGRIKAANREHLAFLGIDREMAERIAVQFNEFGEKADGVWIAGTERWNDREAVRFFRAALAKDVDRTIVTPGAGDRPLWMSNEVGKMVGQFKTFSMASAQRVLLSGLQQRDMAVLNGSLLMVGLGTGVYVAKTWQSGREISDDPAVLLAEGIDRSGLTGWFYDVNNMLEKTTGVGINQAIGGPGSSRYAARNTAGALLGPSVGTVTDLARVGHAATKGEPWRKSDTRAVRRLLPYQNLFYMRNLLDQAQTGINQSIGAEGK